MKTYNTIDGIKRLKDIGNGFLFDSDTNYSYEKRLCKEVKTKKKREPTGIITVVRSGNTPNNYHRLFYKKIKFYKNETEEQMIDYVSNKYPDAYDIK